MCRKNISRQLPDIQTLNIRQRAFGFGDSFTNASVYSGRIAELAREDGLPLRLIGTRGPGAEAQPELADYVDLSGGDRG